MAAKTKSKAVNQNSEPAASPDAEDATVDMAQAIGDKIDELDKMGVDHLVIVAPLADPPESESQHAKVEVRLNKAEKEAFMRLRSGLRKTNARLSDGRPVWSSADVVRWIAQQIA